MNNIQDYLLECLLDNKVDIAVFAEHDGIDFFDLQSVSNDEYRFVEGLGGCDRIALFVRQNIRVTVKREQDRYVLFLVDYETIRFILAGIHLQDRWTNDTPTRLKTIRDLLADIRSLEQSAKCKNIIITGDFNANPYDPELLQVDAFNSVLFKDVIKRSGTRTYDGTSYQRFYNPVLRFISEEPINYGSFYNNHGSATPIWHCLDQVLVSKSLVDYVWGLSYLRQIKGKSLLKIVSPNANISDHLPLLVRFEGFGE